MDRLARPALQLIGVGNVFGRPIRPSGALVTVARCGRDSARSCSSLVASIVEHEPLLQTVDDGEIPAVGR